VIANGSKVAGTKRALWQDFGAFVAAPEPVISRFDQACTIFCGVVGEVGNLQPVFDIFGADYSMKFSVGAA